MAQRRKPRKKPQKRPAAKARPAAFTQPTTDALGQPVESGRPYVTSTVWYAVQRFAPGTDPPPVVHPSGSPGRYRVTKVLAVPGCNVVQQAVDFPALLSGGDSLLEAPGGSGFEVEISDGLGSPRSISVGVNKHRRLRDLSMELHAEDVSHAAATAHNLMASLLSRWAYAHDVAITTSGEEIVEIATGTQHWTVRIVGAVKALSDIEGSSSPEHQILLSSYRDGVSSTEPLWQALSMFRVVEAVLAMRRTRSVAIRDAGGTPAQRVEQIPADFTAVGQPNDRGLAGSLEPYAGRKFTAVLDEIRPRLRHAIAHLDPDSEMILADRWADIQAVERVLPALRWMARQLLETELQAQAPLNRPGVSAGPLPSAPGCAADPIAGWPGDYTL